MKKEKLENDLKEKLDNAIGEHLEQIKLGKVNSDSALYDLIMGDKNIGCSIEEKEHIERMLSLKKKLDVSDDELRKIISEIGFSDSIPLVVRLYIVREQLQEQYGKRWQS